MTSEKLAFDNDMSKAYVSEIERGRISPSLQKLETLANGLGVEVYDLFVNPDKDLRAKVVAATREASAAQLKAIFKILSAE